MNNEYTFDFSTIEGKRKAKESIRELILKDDKEQISKLLFILLDSICSQETKIENLNDQIIVIYDQLNEKKNY